MTGRTETWRKGRRILDGSLRPGAMLSYRQGMQEKTYELLAQLRESPNDFRAHLRLSVDHPRYVVWLLTARQPSGKTYHVNCIRLRPEKW